MGISKEAMEWFRSYLTRRKQSVRIGCKTSEPHLVLYGAYHQDLGDYSTDLLNSKDLLNIYINDLPSVPKVGP